MALKLYYKEGDVYTEISSGNTQANPLTTVHDGKTGDFISAQLFLRNDDATKWYSNIVVRPYDLTTTVDKDDTDYESTGWGVKLSQGADEPTLAAWGDIDWGDFINMGDIGESGIPNTATYFPLWKLITCPPNADAQIKNNLTIRVEYTENAV